MGRRSKYPQELRERAVRLVLEEKGQHPNETAAILSIAEKLGVGHEALRKWVTQEERDTGKRPGLTTAEMERLKALERENREPTRFFARRPRISPRRSSTADTADGGLH